MLAEAAVLRSANGDFAIERVEVAEPRVGEALIRVVGVGMCHTDVLPRSLPIPLPAILGHEGAGVVEAVGPGVTSVAVGDHVVLSYDSCGYCECCLEGQPSNCVEFGLRNMSGVRPDGTTGAADADGHLLSSRWFGQGSFATYCLATERNTVVVSKDLDLELLGPLGCGIQTGAGSVLLGLKVSAGSSLAVFGAGAVGLSAIMAAKAAGVTDMVAVDVVQSRLDLALELGASRVIDGRDPDVVELVREGTDAGVDFAFDTTGSSAVIANALNSLTSRGSCGLVGVGPDLQIPLAAIVGRTLTYFLEGTAVPQTFIPRLLTLWQAGLLPFDRLIQRYPLKDINLAEKDSAAGRTVKPVLVTA